MPMLDSPTTALVRLALDAASLRHLAHANNVANAESPGYSPQRVNFEEQLSQLRQTLSGQQPLQMSDLQGVRPFVEQTSLGQGLSAAQALDQEMVRVAQNTLHYQALLRASSRLGGIMAMAVEEGRR